MKNDIYSKLVNGNVSYKTDNSGMKSGRLLKFIDERYVLVENNSTKSHDKVLISGLDISKISI